MSLYEDIGPRELEDIMILLRTYRRRIRKALGIVQRAEEVEDYTADTISDIRDALEGEYDT